MTRRSTIHHIFGWLAPSPRRRGAAGRWRYGAAPTAHTHGASGWLEVVMRDGADNERAIVFFATPGAMLDFARELVDVGNRWAAQQEATP